MEKPDRLSLLTDLREALLEAETHNKGWNLIEKYTQPLLGKGLYFPQPVPFLTILSKVLLRWICLNF